MGRMFTEREYLYISYLIERGEEAIIECQLTSVRQKHRQPDAIKFTHTPLH